MEDADLQEEGNALDSTINHFEVEQKFLEKLRLILKLDGITDEQEEKEIFELSDRVINEAEDEGARTAYTLLRKEISKANESARARSSLSDFNSNASELLNFTDHSYDAHLFGQEAFNPGSPIPFEMDLFGSKSEKCDSDDSNVSLSSSRVTASAHSSISKVTDSSPALNHSCNSPILQQPFSFSFTHLKRHLAFSNPTFQWLALFLFLAVCATVLHLLFLPHDPISLKISYRIPPPL